MTLDKLKVAARQHEQRDEWRAAIDLYRQAIRAGGGGEGSADPALYNRIGDLEQKAGSATAACEAWEQAAARYGEQGFFNNAIALCNKILRVDPSRLPAYLELARFQARKRVIYDVRQNLGVYFNQMSARGQGDVATAALDGFGREFSSWKELRQAIDELLGRDSHEEAPVARPSESAREVGLVFLDTATEQRLELAEPEEMVVMPTSFEGKLESGALALEGLESTSRNGAVADPMAEPEGILDFERTADEVGSPELVDGLVTPVIGESHGVESITLDGLESTMMDVPDLETSAEVQLGVPSTPDHGGGIVFLETEAAPDDPLGDRAAGHALLDEGDRRGAIEALERALEGYQHDEDWPRAWQVATELIEAEPRSIARYQTRVEVAARMRDRDRLCQSYQELGDALMREGSHDKAVAVYRRVLEIDDTHPGARTALRQMTPDAPSAETADGYIDLGAMLIDDAPRTTRMRTETTAISADEDETFREALAEFKRALDQNLPMEDHQTHYDLGVAFMEMGLLTEAISEFQKALRSPVNRLRTSEALGQAFFDQGRPAVAEAVLRAVEKGDEGDADKIGVLYWLGRSCEAQGKTKNALQCYERVLAVDVNFRDVSDRISQLGTERSG